MDLSTVLDALNAYQEAQNQCTWADANLARVRENLATAEGIAEQRRAVLLAAQGALIAALQGAGFVLAPAPRPAETAEEGPVEKAEGAETPHEGGLFAAGATSRQGRKNGRGEVVLAALRAAGAGGLTKGEVLAAVAEGPPGGWTAANVQSALQRLALDGKAVPPAPYSRGTWTVGAEGPAETAAPAETPRPMFSLGRAALLAVGRLLARGGVVSLGRVQGQTLDGFCLSPTERHQALGRALSMHIARGRAVDCEGGYRALPAMADWLPKEGA